MKRVLVVFICLLISLSMVACGTVKSAERIVDNPLLYQFDRGDSLRVLYVTIFPNKDGKANEMSWEELNQTLKTTADMQDLKQIKEIKFPVMVQEGTEEGLQLGMYGYGRESANATISLRGQSALGLPQKSYKIKLNKNEAKWNNQSTINLMKHQLDLTRIRNKLSFDYFKLIPDIISFRTQFVQLYVKDLSKEPADQQFIDYGLFTQIEQPDAHTLSQHGLDPKGQLYKAAYFEFFRYPDELKLKTDPTYDDDKFQSILEIKGNKDHTKLLNMLDDLNNYELDIDEVFDRHFERNNFLTWLAVTILFNNFDTNSQNFYLYSPSKSNTWYFIPWDYDKGWDTFRENGWDNPGKHYDTGYNWEVSISNYWDMVLVKRFFRNPNNVEALNQKMIELLEIIRPEQTKKFIDQYQHVVKPFMERAPDNEHMPGSLAEYELMLNSYFNYANTMAQMHFEHIERPMPFYLGEVSQSNGKLFFFWGEAYDLQRDPVKYHLQIALDPFFETIVSDLDHLTKDFYYHDMLPSGVYYWRIIARDSKGNKMGSFDKEKFAGKLVRGVKQFVVE